MELTSVYSKLNEGKVIDMPTFKDIDTSTYAIVKQIKDAYASGNTVLANQLRQDNATALEGISISAAQMFQLFEEVRNVEILAMSRNKDIYYDEDGDIPSSLSVGDVFISPSKTFQ